MLERQTHHHGRIACGKNVVRVRFHILAAMIQILTNCLDSCTEHFVRPTTKANHGVGDVLPFLL